MGNWTTIRSGMTPAGSSLRNRLTLLGVLALLLPTQVLAQGIVGRVLDAETETPVSYAMVVLTDVAGNVVGQAVTDGQGTFSILVGQQGNFRVSIEMLGYETGGIGRLSFSDTQVQGVDLMITPVPLELDGLTVETDDDKPLTYIQKTGFYSRKMTGLGEYLEPTKDERDHALLATDYVRRLPGLMVRDGVVLTARGAVRGAYAASVNDNTQIRAGIQVAEFNGQFASCPLKVLLDGMDMGMDLDFIASRVEVLAIEVYKGFATIPARWQNTVQRGTRDKNGTPTPTCGLILVWSRLG